MTETPWVPVLWFVAIVALIPVALWLLRRSPVGGTMAASGLRTVGQLPLSASQRVVTIEIGSGDADHAERLDGYQTLWSAEIA